MTSIEAVLVTRAFWLLCMAQGMATVQGDSCQLNEL